VISIADNGRFQIVSEFRRRFLIFDRPLTIILSLILLLGCLAVFSAAMDYPGRFEGHLRNIFIGLAVM
jgi:rod shape determining protein RodA